MSNLPTAQQNISPPAATNGSQTFSVRDYLTILLSLVIVGLAIAIVLYWFSPTVYQNSLEFRISKSGVDSNYHGVDFSSIIDVRHDQLLPQPNIIFSSMEQHKLDGLQTFLNQPRSTNVSLVQENLTVTQNPFEPSLYKIAYRCNDSEEARIIVSGILSSYNDELVRSAKQIMQSRRDYVENCYEAASDDYEDAKINLDKKSLEHVLQRKNYFEDQRFALRRSEPKRSFSFRIFGTEFESEVVWPRMSLFLTYGAVGGGIVGVSLILLMTVLSKLT